LREYYQQGITPNAAQGVAREIVRQTLAGVEPRILKSLAERCLKRTVVSVPSPDTAQPGDWCDPLDELLWGHVLDAGRVSSIGVSYSNLVPLKAALVRWAKDGSRHRWNLCDNEGAPLEWIADVAVEMLNVCRQKERLPKELHWFTAQMDVEYSAPIAKMQFLLESESQIDDVRRPRLSYRSQRKTEQEYRSLAKDLDIHAMPRVSSHYFTWYVLRTFLGCDLREIRIRTGETVGTPTDHSAYSKGIRTVGNLVDFHRR